MQIIHSVNTGKTLLNSCHEDSVILVSKYEKNRMRKKISFSHEHK
jgi:hypothetical protein